ncbi:MAG: tetratricopeptide repeat protein [Salinivirgaceae bacterium]
MRNIFLLISIIVLPIALESQTIRNLSNQEQTQISRLQEMADISMREGDIEQSATSYSLIAMIYWKAGRLREAVDNFISSSELFLQKNKYLEARNIYSNIGVIYTDLEELEFALEYFNKSLSLRRKIGDKTEIAAGLFDVAYILQVMGFYDDAIKQLNEALTIATELKNSRLIMDCYQLLSLNYEQNGNLRKSKEFAAKAQEYEIYLQEESMKEQFTSEVIETQKQVAKTEEEKRLAAELFKLQQLIYEQTQDSLGLAIRAKQDSLSYAQELSRTRSLQIENLNKEKELTRVRLLEQEAKARNQQLIIGMVAIGLGLMVILAVVMLRANRARQRANKKLEKQNKEIVEKSEQLGSAMRKIAHQNQNITQSINYAKGIQKALLPKPGQLNDFIKDSFILFKPRDIVSGDFYWFREIDSKSDIFKIFGMHRRDTETNQNNAPKKLAVSAVDCTGHGVPGAFMSMIGYNLLDEITNKGITRPDLILEELHRGVRFTLKQKETSNQDGMDMALCVIDREEKTLEFAGAKNPLIYISNDHVEQIKGDKNGIGGKNDDHKFTLHKIEVNGPTWFYLFSDGYIDQFGGDNGRKFMIKNFREMIAEIYQWPMEQQKEHLEKELKSWMGTKYNQIDDVLVIGFKLDFTSN